MEALSKYFSPSVNEIAKTFKFYKAEQGSKSVKDLIIDLKLLADKCNFAAFLDCALRDKFVCGARDNQLKSTFLKQASLTFSQACDIALSWEMAEGEKILTILAR